MQNTGSLASKKRRQVGAAVKEGLSLEDTRKRVDLNSFREALAGADEWRQEGFDEFFLQPAVERAYKEAKGEPMDEAQRVAEIGAGKLMPKGVDETLEAKGCQIIE